MLYNGTCIICSCPTALLHTVEWFPMYMGAVKSTDEDFDYEMLEYSFCTQCSQIQLGYLVPLERLYSSNHNIDVVGPTWQHHFQEFAVFYKHNSRNAKHVLEIGDPSGKVAKRCSVGADKWLIIDANPDKKSDGNVKWIKGFFTKGIVPESSADCIVHSHLFEHQYKPLQFLKDCHDTLRDGGTMIFSIPDMEAIIRQFNNPVLAINFEHPYYLDQHNVEYLLAKAGFRLIDVHEFGNHSLFLACEKVAPYELPQPRKSNENALNKFVANVESSQQCSSEIANKLSKIDGKVYLYQCHVTSQYILKTGVPESKIKMILDNAPSKQEKRLYGTNLLVVTPTALAADPAPVITSHTGIYREEIEAQLRYIYPDVQFL